jgi:3-phenylpropionate/trans-cinnamate dioxygenase ferredoxin component
VVEAAVASWHRVAEEGELAEGALLPVEAGRERIVLARVDGAVYALRNRCSHADFPLHDGILEGTTLECAHHGARFDVCTGRVKRFPAVRPVPIFPVEVRDGGIHVELP